jgi:hypothetical protein
VTTVYQGSCAHCEQRVRTDENHLKAHLWASTAVFHWECFIVLMKEHRNAPAQDATGKVSRDTRGKKGHRVEAADSDTERNGR